MLPATRRNFKERLLDNLEAHGVTEESIARQLKDAIRGVRRKRTYEVDKGGALVLTKVEVMTTPKDQAAGALLYDALHGGTLGLTPKQLSGGQPATSEMYKRFAPVVDRRVIAVVGGEQEVGDGQDGEDPESDQVSFAVAAVAEAPVEDDESFDDQDGTY